MSELQIANVIAMAAASDVSFAVIRAKPLSQWKGLASAQSALGAMNALFLARRNVEGPMQVIEGPNGVDNLLHMQIRTDWDKQGYEGVLESTIKKYNSMIHTQSAVHCMVELQLLLKKVSVRPDQEFSDQYPAKMPARIVVRLQDGKVINLEVQDSPGLASRPFSWEESVEKFNRLVAGRADEGTCREIKDAAHSLENIQVADLMALLGRVNGVAAARH